MQLLRSLLFTTYMMVSALPVRRLHGAVLLAAVPRAVRHRAHLGALLFWMLERLCGLSFVVEGREHIPAGQSHRHEQSHLGLGDGGAIS